MPTYTATDSIGDKRGKPCAHCGEPGWEHEKERVNRPNGRYGYRFWCPGTKPEDTAGGEEAGA